MNFKEDTKRFKRMTETYDEVKYICKCVHRVIIPNGVNKQICDWCNNYVFKNKKEEFKYRLKEEMRRNVRK